MYIDKDECKIYTNSKGLFHRLDGPAIDYANKYKAWYKKGKCHRSDGPAIEWINGNKAWYIFYKYLKEEEFNSWINRIKIFI